ncbi:MAG: hypothetical protein UR28_C0009G0009 [Candidatus Peregrinibacteria bacterium GW2011_GWF2_33_10]|nr:MAG: hypothetical protein UR28_C0009G0009 [Candidatus Peregrinibacteria bacterium GW2011_GWF2_33_10]OGJ44728.1 MAG: hypothetical protein A2263_02060 [Candidatus Peregrinibacteria bacterium RIFOXYA2_FULL_33_21]OGJ46767.1 MAG: hypothetical protein A2272_02290 [Candidatus Peregrinibacteria bacterium RIFOXYA12_FULL_33_12]OGJ50594.1 MAG: hypothetical protein A2307_00045 [Candidatus Peregrinibacteria bacterium RIFOXYB2_FULL_33_20]
MAITPDGRVIDFTSDFTPPTPLDFHEYGLDETPSADIKAGLTVLLRFLSSSVPEDRSFDEKTLFTVLNLGELLRAADLYNIQSIQEMIGGMDTVDSLSEIIEARRKETALEMLKILKPFGTIPPGLEDEK